MDTTTEEKRSRGRPATGLTPKRAFRLDEESWRLIVSAASECGETTSDYMRRVLLKNAATVLKKRE